MNSQKIDLDRKLRWASRVAAMTDQRVTARQLKQLF
jgi:hypothetical protein